MFLWRRKTNCIIMSKRKSNLSLADVLSELGFDSEGYGKDETDDDKAVNDQMILGEKKPFLLEHFLFLEELAENDNVITSANKPYKRDILDYVADLIVELCENEISMINVDFEVNPEIHSPLPLVEFLEDGPNISEEISVADTEDIREHIQESNKNADKVNVEGNTVEDVLSVISGILDTTEKNNNKNIEDDVKCVKRCVSLCVARTIKPKTELPFPRGHYYKKLIEVSCFTEMFTCLQ